MKKIGKFYFLTREEEQTASAEALIVAHKPLVINMARKFARYGADVDDLIQEGNIGLIIAADRFDRSKGNRFATYAQFWVRAMLRDYVVKYGRIVRTPTTASWVKDFFGSKIPKDASFDATVARGDGLLGDLLPSPLPGPDELVEQMIDAERLEDSIKAAIAELPARSADIIEARFFRDGKESLDVIGARHGISKERVRQIEEKALKEIRRMVQQ